MKIGTCVRGENLISALPSIINNGFETVEVYFDRGLNGTDLVTLSQEAKEIAEDKISFTCIGVYVNPLQYEKQRQEVEACIENAGLFGANVISTFAGAIEAVDSSSLGLTWEPAHQLEQFIDVYEQLRDWSAKIVHVHGKDGKIDTEHVKKYGAWFGQHYCDHRFPGLGDSDWTRIMRQLRDGGYKGDIVIEGFHDPVYRMEREMEGQLIALNYLRKCRENI